MLTLGSVVSLRYVMPSSGTASHLHADFYAGLVGIIFPILYLLVDTHVVLSGKTGDDYIRIFFWQLGALLGHVGFVYATISAISFLIGSPSPFSILMVACLGLMMAASFSILLKVPGSQEMNLNKNASADNNWLTPMEAMSTEGNAHPLNDNESRERVLVGEVIKATAEAGHIFREVLTGDHGIDGEIEFKNERGEASGQRVYLQLKSGDSHLRLRNSDGKEIFTIKDSRHVEYWQSHAYPVLLVIRNSEGQNRWMDVSEYLRHSAPGIKQIEFRGQPFTAQSVKKIGDAILIGKSLRYHFEDRL